MRLDQGERLRLIVDDLALVAHLFRYASKFNFWLNRAKGAYSVHHRPAFSLWAAAGRKRIGGRRSTHEVSSVAPGLSMKSATILAPQGLNCLTLWPTRGNSIHCAAGPINSAT